MRAFYSESKGTYRDVFTFSSCAKTACPLILNSLRPITVVDSVQGGKSAEIPSN
jgi:hypothetical protein